MISHWEMVARKARATFQPPDACSGLPIEPKYLFMQKAPVVANEGFAFLAARSGIEPG